MPDPGAQPLLGNRDFRRLWAGDAVSQFGSQLSMLALPVLAVQAFGAGELEMGILEACATVAFLVVGLPSGAWVDRMRRRRVLVVTDLVRAAALASLPVALLLDAGSLTHLYVVALVTGTCTVFFDVAWQSFLPAIVRREQLVEGNAKLSATAAVASVGGPGIGGLLLRAFGAPLVVAIDAASFVVSALFVRGIRTHEEIEPAGRDRSLRREVMEGLRFVLGHPLLRRITICTSLANLSGSISGALLILFMLRDLGIGEATIGLVFAVGSLGALLGAFTATRAARLVGEGRIIPLSAAIWVLPASCIPLAPRLAIDPAITIAAASFVIGWTIVTYNITQVSFRQRLCPPRLLGRMNATVRFLVWGTLPIGSIAGGLAGEAFGIVPVLWAAVVIAAIGVVPVAWSPLRTMRTLPDVDERSLRV